MELSPEQVILVGLIASALTLGIKLLAQWFGYVPGRAPLTIVLYVIAFVLAGVWNGITFPPFPPFVDPVSFIAAVLQFAADILALAAPVVGLATLIYNLLYEKVVVTAVQKVKAAAK